MSSTSHHNFSCANPYAQRQAGMICRWNAKSPTGPPVDPGPSKGIHERMLMEFVSTGTVLGSLRWPGWK
eukprot:1151633-Pelagomonas_calceolata.AAC.6